MYEMGWNLICFVSGSNWNFYSYPHFQTPPKTDSASFSGYHGEDFRGMFGGTKDGDDGNDITREFNGIIHTVHIKNTEYSTAQIESNWLVPRASAASL